MSRERKSPVILAQQIKQRLAACCLLVESLEQHAVQPDKFKELAAHLIFQHQRVLEDFTKWEKQL